MLMWMILSPEPVETAAEARERARAEARFQYLLVTDQRFIDARQYWVDVRADREASEARRAAQAAEKAKTTLVSPP